MATERTIWVRGYDHKSTIPMNITTRTASRSTEEARVMQAVAGRVKVNRLDINSYGSVGDAQGFSGNVDAPISSISFSANNTKGTKGRFVFGDPKGLIAAATAQTFEQPTSVRGSAVAAVQESFSSTPVAVKGLNLIVSDQKVFGNSLMYWRADRDGRIFGRPIAIDEFLRNNQDIATRQTLRFQTPYVLDTFGAFTLDLDDGEGCQFVLLLGANLV